MLLFTKPERNEIYDAIARSDLDPAECDFDVFQSGATLTHNSGSRLEFRVNRTGTQFRVHSVIADVSDEHDELNLDISSVAPYVTDWANQVKQGIELIDLWTEMKHGQEVLSDIQSADSTNTAFTQDEQKQIAAQLQEIKMQLAKRFELTSEQIEQVTEKLDEAEEASKRMGRKDWLIYFLGTISALTIAATVAPGIGEHIFTMFIHALGHLFTGGSEPPQIPPQIIS
jgi:hypothetical protein